MKSTKLTADSARALAARLVMEEPGMPALRAIVQAARTPARSHEIVFLGGRFGRHHLSVELRTREEILAHWAGYCEQNGYNRVAAEACAAAPAVGASIGCHEGRWPRSGQVTKVGPRRVTMAFRRRNGSVGTLTFPIDLVTKNVGLSWTGRGRY